MVFENVNPGIQLVEQFGQLNTGIWLLSHHNEGVILEMPDYSEEERFDPWQKLDEYIMEHNIYIKFSTATHNHTDHFSTFPQFHEEFSEIPIVVNSNFFRNFAISKFISAEDLESDVEVEPSIFVKNVPVYCFKEQVFQTHLSGEPLYLIKAPKHSWSDTIVIFRGTMITSDWWIGKGDPNKNNIPESVINDSISLLQEFTRQMNYKIHSLISVHANEFRRNIDFINLMEETRPGSKP